MNEDKLIDKNWIDIVPINIIDKPDYAFIILTIAGIVLLLGTLGYLYSKQPKIVFKRQLNSLRKQNKNLNNKSILLKLEKSLCDYYHVTQISMVSFSDKTWSEFKSRLHEACYAAVIPDDETTQELIQQATRIYRQASAS